MTTASAHFAKLPSSPLQPVLHAEAARALEDGGLIVLVQRDSRGRARGGLAGVAALMTAENATLMAVYGRGLLCVVVDPAVAARLEFRPMCGDPGHLDGRPNYLASIEAATCRGTGISAADRAMTMRAAGHRHATAADILSPGHVMPILVSSEPDRPDSLPQAAHRLVCGMTNYDVAAWCDVLDGDGELANSEDCSRLAEKLELPVVYL